MLRSIINIEKAAKLTAEEDEITPLLRHKLSTALPEDSAVMGVQFGTMAKCLAKGGLSCFTGTALRNWKSPALLF